MRCPKCGHCDSKVIDSRPSENNVAIRRRRECVACGFRFTTYERREEIPLLVVKRDGSRETFNREKLMNGLIRATVKRDISVLRLEELIDTIQNDLRDAGRSEVTSAELGDLILKELLDLDKVAYIRFASVYKDFHDVEEFMDELRSLNA